MGLQRVGGAAGAWVSNRRREIKAEDRVDTEGPRYMEATPIPMGRGGLPGWWCVGEVPEEEEEEEEVAWGPCP